MPDRRKKDSNY